MAYYPPPSQTPTGLVVLLHELSANAAAWCSDIGVPEYTHALGFVALCPQALDDERLGNMSYWRAWPQAGYGFHANDGPEDLDFLEALIEWAHGRTAIPPHRTFIMGCSNGGSLAYRLACERPHHFDGVAVFCQEWFDPALGWNVRQAPVGVRAGVDDDRCSPARVLPIWAGMGSADEHYNTTAKRAWLSHSQDVLHCSDAVHEVDRQSHCKERRVCGARANPRVGGSDDMHVRSRFCYYAAVSHACTALLGIDHHQALVAAWNFLSQPQISHEIRVRAPQRSHGDETRVKAFSPSTPAILRRADQPPSPPFSSSSLVWIKVAHCSRRRCGSFHTACSSEPTCNAAWQCVERCSYEHMVGTRTFNKAISAKGEPGTPVTQLTWAWTNCPI